MQPAIPRPAAPYAPQTHARSSKQGEACCSLKQVHGRKDNCTQLRLEQVGWQGEGRKGERGLTQYVEQLVAHSKCAQ